MNLTEEEKKEIIPKLYNVSAKKLGIMQRILECNVDRGLSISKIAEEVGVSRPTVNNYMKTPEYKILVDEYIKEITSNGIIAKAWKTLEKAMDSGKPHAVKAAQEILDRLVSVNPENVNQVIIQVPTVVNNSE